MICELDGCTENAAFAVGAGGLDPDFGPHAHLRVCVGHAEEAAGELVAAVLRAHGVELPLAAPSAQTAVVNRLADTTR